MKVMKSSFISIFILTLILTGACFRENSIDSTEIKKNIYLVMDSQIRAWNDGNIEEYMSGYYPSDSLRFASGGSVSYGWEETLERYQRGYPDKESMGILSFTEIDIKVISDDAALVFGRWKLERVSNTSSSGLFTLVFQKTNIGWRIIHDHTSSHTN